MSANDPRATRLIAMTERLTEALKADIAALERGRPREMRTIEPEIQTLVAVFGREVAAFNASAAKHAPAEARRRLAEANATFKDTLARQTRILTRMRRVSEGMIRAIAEDVARRKSAARPYAPMAPRPRSPGAMIYNRLA